MAIIEQENTVFYITTTNTTGAKESSSRPETGTSLYRISSIKSRARTMHCKETAQARIKSLLERHALDRSYRFMNGTLSHSVVSAA